MYLKDVNLIAVQRYMWSAEGHDCLSDATAPDTDIEAFAVI